MLNLSINRLCVRVSIDLAAILFVAVLTVVCAKIFVHFHFKFEGTSFFRLRLTALSLTPTIAAYLVCRLFFSVGTATALTSVLVVGLSYASFVKSALTGEPLSFSDISRTANMSIIAQYANIYSVSATATALVWLASMLWLFDRKTWRDRLARRKWPVLAVLVGGVSLSLTGRSVGDDFSNYSSKVFSKLGLGYLSYDWPKNVRLNGLGVHLVQTSARHMPDRPTEAESGEFKDLIRPARADFQRPRTVIMILCEACWNDSRHFSDLFKPLVDRGMVPFRGVSPTYGGGTVNAAFEMITGLPANGNALTGIIYQEYATVLSDQTHALPRYLDQDGYRTMAMHNHTKRFWNRDIVSPKLGFDEFLGIEDMTPSPPQGWADDEFLYDTALKAIDEHTDQPLFMHLTTVYTHGDYERRGGWDLGEAHYREKLGLSVERLASFVDHVYARDPDALMLVYGDHKPQLTAFFLREGILPRSVFERVGKLDMDFTFASGYPRDVVGDMPVFVRSGDASKVADFVQQADGLPFFCVSKFFDRTFLKSAAPVYRFSGDVCRAYKDVGYQKTVDAFPNWLYSKALLKY